MRAIYNKKTRLIMVLMPFLISACTFFTDKPPEQKVTAIALPPAMPQQQAICACETTAPKEVIKIVEKPCPVLVKQLPAKVKKKAKLRTLHDKQIVGRIEYITINETGLAIKGRIDTGAKTSSLNALDLTSFERDGKKWVRFAVINPNNDEKVYLERKVKRFVRIKQMVTENQRRPVVEMTLRLGQVEESVEVSLTDRSHYVYQLLLGRNFLLDRMLVDVSQKYTQKSYK